MKHALIFWYTIVLLFFPQTGLPVVFRKKETGHAAGRPGLGWAWIWFIFMCISETWIERRKKSVV